MSFRKKHHVVNTGEVAPVFKGRNSNELWMSFATMCQGIARP